MVATHPNTSPRHQAPQTHEPTARLRSSRIRYAGIALLMSATLGLGALFLHASSAPQSAANPGPNEASATLGQANAERATTLPLRQWKPGDSFVYNIETTRSMALSNEADAEQAMQYKVVGTLRCTVVGAQGKEVRLRFDLGASSVELRPTGKMGAKEAAEWLSRTFYANAHTSGAMASFLFPKDVPVEARNLLKGIASSLEWVAPEAPAASWHAFEQDVSGQYDAAYHATDAFTIEKSKQSYVQMRGAEGLKPIQRGTQFGVTSKATFVLDASGFPKSLKEDESLEIKAQGMTALGKIKTLATLLAQESHPEWVGELAPDLETDAQADAAAAAMSMKQADINLVGGRSLQDIQAELNAEGAKTRNQAQARMAALLRVEPNKAKEVGEEVLHGKSDTNAKKRLIGALGNAGTKEAQHELAKILDAEDVGDLRVNAGISMGLLKHPTEETSGALQKAMSSPATKVDSTATLALGGMVRSMNADGSGDTSDELKLLTDGLSHAESDVEKKLYLDALGNTGDLRAFSVILPYLSSENVALRAAAVGALKFMVGELVDQAIVAAFSDPEVRVRKAAAHTIGFRPISAMLGAIDTLMHTEQVESVRQEALSGMAIKIHEDAGVIDLVEWVMENDASEKVRRAAKEIVDGVALEGP